VLCDLFVAMECQANFCIFKKPRVTCSRSDKAAIKSRIFELAAHHYDAKRRAKWGYWKEKLQLSRVPVEVWVEPTLCYWLSMALA
jgi:hypothetical protein